MLELKKIFGKLWCGYRINAKQSLSLSLLLALLIPAPSYANRAIALYYDDSGSMTEPIQRWYSANYSTQLLSALKSQDDELYVVKMTTPTHVEKIQSESQINTFIQKMQQEPTPTAGTPYTGMTTLVQSLAKSQAKEKWLIVVTDGKMDSSSQTTNQIQQDKSIAEKIGIRTIFVLVEQGADRQLAEFWNNNNPNYIIQTNSAKLTGVMTKLASTVTGRDNQGLNLQQMDNTVTVSSLFPLRNLVVITQGQHKVSVTHAHLLSQSGKRPLTLTTHDIALHPHGVDNSSSNLPRFGNVAHLSFGGAIDVGDEKAEIIFNHNTKGLDLAVLPEVAGRLNIEVLDDNEKPLSKNSEGSYETCIGATVQLRSHLIADNSKSLISYATNPTDFDVGFDGQTPFKSTLSANKDYFETTISPTSKLALYAFAKYPHYFNFQSQPITFNPINCKRTIDIVSTTTLNDDNRFVRSLDELSDDDKLEYTITIDGQPASKHLLDTWQWQYDHKHWQLHTDEGRVWFTPHTACCALVWARQQAVSERFQLTLATGNQYDTINYPTTIHYDWQPPEGLAKIWWLLCPIISAFSLIMLGWYLWRILIVKQRFNRRAKLHIYESATRLIIAKRFVPTSKLLSHWLLPVKHEVVRIDGLTFEAIGKTTTLVKGAGLTEFHEIPNWNYDPTKPMDAKVSDMWVIELYDNRGKIIKLMQFSATGQSSTFKPDDYKQ